MSENNGNIMAEYVAKATKYCIDNQEAVVDWNMLPDNDKQHIFDIAASIMMTRDNYCPGGGFVQNVIKNDLRAAVCSADHICIRALKLFVFVNQYSFL